MVSSVAILATLAGAWTASAFAFLLAALAVVIADGRRPR